MAHTENEEEKQAFRGTEWLKWIIIIYGVIIGVIELLFYVGRALPRLPELLEIVLVIIVDVLLLALGFFGLVFLFSGLSHPKWYVKGYSVVCLLWECYQTFVFVGWFGFSVGDIEGTWIFHNFIVRAVPPLIPIWYWSYKKFKKEEEEGIVDIFSSDWKLDDQLKGLKEQLDSGHITQEEYEQKKKAKIETHEDMQQEIFGGLWLCGNCKYYLMPECPRQYNGDSELHREQTPCEKFLLVTDNA